ncbi:MAG: FAD-dependent oxidoreductase [Deltaproteobacteria bacterium]|nr:FAD-dependent oxidoreductase [Deltaproteobacteria bacterium]
MDDRKVDVAIVGGGLAGAAAAGVLGRHGVNVLMLDDNLHPGGQYLRGGRRSSEPWSDGIRRRGLRLIERLPQSSVEIASRAEVLGIEAGFELLIAWGNGEISTVKCERILLATGARERFIPFKGWTLPGVMATGAAQILIKQSGILPAREMLVGGTGLFLAAVARDIQKSGGRVPAVLNETAFFQQVPPPGLMARQFAKFAQGGAMLARLRLAGTDLRNGTRILAARGDDRLREVVAARVDKEGTVMSGSEVVYPSGCLGVGFGFTANIELAQLAGCGLAFDSELGGWVVRVNEDLETSVDGIHAAGEITAVGGAAKSLTEGRLAGCGILRRMGLLKPDRMGAEVSALKKMRRRQMAFARYFNSQYLLSPEYTAGWIRSLADDVPVCRCEEVSLGEVREAVAEGFDTPAGVKKATRCGMGICQGSTCKTILSDVLAAITGKPLARIPLPSARLPVKPIYLGSLAGEKP